MRLGRHGRRLDARVLVLPALFALAAPARLTAGSIDPRWIEIGRVFGQRGEVEGSCFGVDLPRTDLHVHIGRNVLSPRFDFTSHIGFVPVSDDHVMAMGEVVLRDGELPAVLGEAHRQNVSLSAVQQRLVGESPRIVYVQVTADGEARDVATRLRTVIARSATPFAVREERPEKIDWSAIDALLGPHVEAAGAVAAYVFPRNEALAVREIPIESSHILQSASEAVFQRLPGGRMASAGELCVQPREVDPVARTLDEHGLHVTAIHNHRMDETPLLCWIHWYATGDGRKLARDVAAALAHTNSRKSEPQSSSRRGGWEREREARRERFSLQTKTPPGSTPDGVLRLARRRANDQLVFFSRYLMPQPIDLVSATDTALPDATALTASFR